MVLKRPVIIGYGLSWNLVKRMTFLDPGPRGLDENQGSRRFFLDEQRRACVQTGCLQDEGHRRGCLTVYQPRPIGYLRLIDTAR